MKGRLASVREKDLITHLVVSTQCMSVTDGETELAQRSQHLGLLAVIIRKHIMHLHQLLKQISPSITCYKI